MTNLLPDRPDSGWKTRTYAMGGVAGLALGILAAYLFVRAAQENGKDKPEQVSTMDVLKLAVALLAIVRQVTDLGSSKK